MTILLSTVAFLMLLTGLVLIHECGHFFMARMMGVHVEEFGVGLPPRFLSLFRWRGTHFTLNAIPVGGFVRLRGEGALREKDRSAPGSFARASIPARSAILLAGVCMNFLLAYGIFFCGFFFAQWVPTYRSLAEMEHARERGEVQFVFQVLVDDVLTEGSAARAGVVAQSILLAVDGRAVQHPSDVVSLQAGKRRVTYSLLRGPTVTEEQKVVVSVEGGKTGVLLRTIPRHLSGPPRGAIAAASLALRESWIVMAETVRGMGMLISSLFRTGVVPREVTGIVGIARLTYTSVQEGMGTYVRLVALMSLSLAALNILPLPALDGGRLLFILAEVVRRRPADRRFELLVNMVGFGFLLSLIILVTFYDVLRLFLS